MAFPEKIWIAGQGKPWKEHLPKGRIVRMSPEMIGIALDEESVSRVIYDRFGKPIEQQKASEERPGEPDLSNT
jgi:hypothetical protein